MAERPYKVCKITDYNCQISLVTAIEVALFALITFTFHANRAQAQECMKHTFGTGEFDIACVCNSTYCDKIQFNWPDQKEILVVETDKSGARFLTRIINRDTYSTSSSSENNNNNNNSNSNNSSNEVNKPNSDILSVRLYPDRKMQKILGFGGSFTDAASYQFQTMSKKLRKYALEDYFGLDGLRYTLGRVPIAGSDFSSRPYTYVDIRSTQTLMEDFNLTRFKLQPEDIALKIPIIRQAQFIVRDSTNYKQKLNLIGSSWSPPAWLKDNGNLVKGKLKGNSSLSYYDTCARYYVRFLQEYKSHGIDFWGITSQNEPIMAKSDKVQFNSMIFEPNELKDFVRDNLGPILANNGFGRDNLNLLVYDDNTDHIEAYIKSIANDTEAMKYVSGVALHWYGRKTAGYSPIDEIRKLITPSTFILSTEASNIHGPKPGRWENGVEYAYDIIQTLRRHSIGWIDWNLALDMMGGPNWSENYVDAPILFDEEKQIYYKSPVYYLMAHFTRFFEPLAQVIESEVQSTSEGPIARDITNPDDTNVDVIASERPNGMHYSVVILNRSSQEKVVKIELSNETILEGLLIKAYSITTLAIPTRKETEDDFQDQFIKTTQV